MCWRPNHNPSCADPDPVVWLESEIPMNNTLLNDSTNVVNSTENLKTHAVLFIVPPISCTIESTVESNTALKSNTSVPMFALIFAESFGTHATSANAWLA